MMMINKIDTLEDLLTEHTYSTHTHLTQLHIYTYCTHTYTHQRIGLPTPCFCHRYWIESSECLISIQRIPGLLLLVLLLSLPPLLLPLISSSLLHGKCNRSQEERSMEEGITYLTPLSYMICFGSSNGTLLDRAVKLRQM